MLSRLPRVLLGGIALLLGILFLAVTGRITWHWFWIAAAAISYGAAVYYSVRAKQNRAKYEELENAVVELVESVEDAGVGLPIDRETLVEDLRHPRTSEYLKEFALWAEGASRLDVGVAILDGDQIIQNCNRSFSRLIGTGYRDTVGQGLTLLLRDPELERRLALVMSGESRSETVEIERADDRYFLVHLAQLRREPVSLMVTLEDITELRRLQRVRQEFIANVSHELRTPLTVMRGYAELLEDDEDLDERSRELAGKIRRKSGQLAEVVRDTLSLSKIELGGRDLEAEVFDPVHAAEEVVRTHRRKSKDKELELSVDVSGEIPELESDPDGFHTVLSNLVDNAIKYTDPGGEVRIELSNQGNRVRVDVVDNGAGIPSGEQERIFERFYRVAREQQEEVEGSGLGLSIVKHLLQRLGVQYELDSELGEGTRFTTLWPVADRE